MILAAGLGTRLKPWTLSHPKAMVPVEGIPVVRRLVEKLRDEDFSEAIVNVHHFADELEDYLESEDMGLKISISDERERLLDTGGALAKVAAEYGSDTPLLVHNVDILSNQDLGTLMEAHEKSGNDITLLTSPRESSRRLIFDAEGKLCGWHDLKNEKYRPEGFMPGPGMSEEAFSGIYVMGPKALKDILGYKKERGEAFPVMDYFLSFPEGIKIGRAYNPELRLLDIGKPDALARAKEYL